MRILTLYLQKGETHYREFFSKEYYELRYGFEKKGFNLVYLPALHQNPFYDFQQTIRQFIQLYYPSFNQLSSIQQEQAMFIIGSSQNEFDIYRRIDEIFGLQLQNGAYLFFLKSGMFEIERLTDDSAPSVALSEYLPKKYIDPIFDNWVSASIPPQKKHTDPFFSASMPHGSGLSNKQGLFKEIKDWMKSGEDLSDGGLEELPNFLHDDKDDAIITPEIKKLFIAVNNLNLHEGLKQLIEFSFQQFQNSQLGADGKSKDQPPIPNLLANSVERVFFSQDDRLFIGDLEIKLNPICLALYKLFFNHGRGIALKDMGSHREELFGYYKNMATHTDIELLKSRIDALCDPRENSINEKISTINKAFRDLLGDHICIHYQILGERGEAKKINIHYTLKGR